MDQILAENRKLTSELVITKKCEQQVRGKDHRFRKKLDERGAV